MTTLKIFDHTMSLIDEIEADVVRHAAVETFDPNKAYRLGGYAFSVKIDSPACTEETLKLGNFVEVDGRLGTLWTPRTWGDGWVTLSVSFESRPEGNHARST
jgi:hypothetical protein